MYLDHLTSWLYGRIYDRLKREWNCHSVEFTDPFSFFGNVALFGCSLVIYEQLVLHNTLDLGALRCGVVLHVCSIYDLFSRDCISCLSL